MTSMMEQLLTEATDTVLHKRQAEYNQATPEHMHTQIAQVWSGILDQEVTAQQVALCMTGLKLVRAGSSPSHWDSYVDAVGYLGIASMITFTAEEVWDMNTEEFVPSDPRPRVAAEDPFA